MMGIKDNYAMANEPFSDPFGTCCFLNDDVLYLNVFHNYTLTHYHCIWSIPGKETVGPIVKLKLESNLRNFPLKSFHSESTN